MVNRSEFTRIWVLCVPYHERAFAQKSGARWDASRRLFVYEGVRLPAVLRDYESDPLSWERWQEDDLNGLPASVPAPSVTLRPRPHQQEATRAIVKAAYAKSRGFVLADDVGLGKTVSVWAAVQRLHRVRPVRTILVVSPLAVVPHWRRTILDMGIPGGARVCVINYDRVKSLLAVPASAVSAKRRRTKNQRTARQGVPLVNWDVVVLDEAHKCRHADSQRSQAVARIARYGEPAAKAPFVVWMSATIGQNPTELSYVAPLLAQLTGSPASSLQDFGPWLYKQGFHVVQDPRWKKWTWTDNPADRAHDIELMNRLMFTRRTPVALRRLPENIAGWPPVQRVLLPVQLDVEQRRLYEQAWTEFRRELALQQRGKNPTRGLVASLRFRQKASLLRVNGTVQQVNDLLDNGLQVAVSCQFIESLDAIKVSLEKQKVSVAVMDGRNTSVRESERLRFQRGNAQVVLFTPVEGFSLHQNELLADGSHASNTSRALIIHDLRYSGIDTLQIEGRCHRDGQAANVYYTFFENTIEEEVAATLVGRVLSTKELVGDDTATVRLLEGMLNAAADVPVNEHP